MYILYLCYDGESNFKKMFDCSEHKRKHLEHFKTYKKYARKFRRPPSTPPNIDTSGLL